MINALLCILAIITIVTGDDGLTVILLMGILFWEYIRGESS